MAIGNLRTEGDLRRFVQSELGRPGATPPAQPAISLVKNGVPSDSDFPNTPGNGILAYDREGGILYGRIDGEWIEV